MSSVSSLGNLNTITGLNTSGISFSGLISGLDTNQIINAILAPQQARITALQQRQAFLTAQQNAFSTIQSDLTAFQTKANALAQALNNPLTAKTVTSSNTAAVTGAASADAAAGNYTFTINNLAAAEQLGTQGFASATASITHGTLQIQVGSGAIATVTVDSTNDTLQGLANSITSANAGVTASIVNTGAATNPYELVLTSTNTGAANTIQVTNNLAADNGGAIKPNFTTTIQAAQNSSITIGSGPGALTITNPTNQINNVFNGVTLNLLQANPSQPVTITVANDTSTGQKAIQDFVNAYNSLIDFIAKNIGYDTKTNQAGLLLGQQLPNSLLNDLSTQLGNIVAGVNTKANNLSTIGITFDDKGHLNIDSNKLSQALSGQTAGISSNDIVNLFALNGQSNNVGVQFISGSDKTVASGSTPYQVVVTQAATQGSFLATNALAGSVTINNTNNSFTLTVNGTTSNTITLAAGTYTPQTLAQEVQAEINRDPNVGNLATVSLDSSGKLKFSTNVYGTSAIVHAGTGSALTTLGLTGTESGTGQNVAGYFVVNGVHEAATGVGQFLTGNTGNAHTNGLDVRVTLTANQIPNGGSTANLTVTRGIASNVGLTLNSFLDPVNGQLITNNRLFSDQEDAIQKEIDFQTNALQAQQQNLVLEYTNLETVLAQLKNSGNTLASLTANVLPIFSNSNSNTSRA